METKDTNCHPKPLVNATCLLGEKGCFENGKCHYVGNCEHKVLTNADRIRAMSDEELAEKIYELTNIEDIKTMYCDGKAGCITEDGDIICDEGKEKDCILRRLQQPAEGE